MDKTFWINDPSVLINDVSNYIPRENMNEIEKLNSITLFCIILMIIFICFKYVNLALIPLIAIILVIFIYQSKKESFDVENLNGDNIDTNYLSNSLSDTLNIKSVDDISKIEDVKFRKPNDIVNEDINNEIGFYDSDGVLRFNRTTNKIHQNNMPTSYNLNYECRKPTKNNPFMNIQLHDFDNNQYVEACNIEDDKINKDMVHSFNSKLFMNIDDAFSRTNSQRQFFTTPNTRIPNNQIEFANWLYKVPETCKEDNEQCLKYDDIRYNRNRI